MHNNVPQEIKDKLIFALDFQTAEEAAIWVRELSEMVGCFKIGLELFVREGPRALQAVTDNSSANIFLDLKLHDIPATVRGALKSAFHYRARFVTIHCDQGVPLMSGDETSLSKNLELIGITVLTSIAPEDLSKMGFPASMSIQELVLKRTEIARKAGCKGVVASGKEVAVIKKNFGPNFKVITPGIRPKWNEISTDDQARVVTPLDAISAGADHLVVGRPIRSASNPQNAAKRILDEIESGLNSLDP